MEVMMITGKVIGGIAAWLILSWIGAQLSASENTEYRDGQL